MAPGNTNSRRYYLRYGDAELLRRCWPMMRRYADHVLASLGLTDKKQAKANPYNEFTYEKGIHLGEWLEPEEFRDAVYGTQARHPEECTAYLHLMAETMARIADLMGDGAYAGRLRKVAEGSKRAYDHLFVKTGTLDTDRQAKLVRPLTLGLLEGEQRTIAQERLVKAVEDYRYRVGTGFLSTPFLLPALTDAGRADVAYKVLLNEERPGWLAEVADGATTIWEDWEGKLSQNHYSPGAVCQWLFDTVCGIRVAGERRFEIAPVPGDALDRAEASYLSPYGTVKSSWRSEGGTVSLTIEVPANTTAEVRLPDGRIESVSAGRYEYAL